MIGSTAFGSAWRRMTRRPDRTLGAGGADVVLIEHVDHGRAHHARIPAGAEQAERHGRQHDMGECAVAAHREPAERGGEDIEQQQRHDELGRGHADESRHHHQPIDKAATIERGECAKRHASRTSTKMPAAISVSASQAGGRRSA